MLTLESSPDVFIWQKLPVPSRTEELNAQRNNLKCANCRANTLSAAVAVAMASPGTINTVTERLAARIASYCTRKVAICLDYTLSVEVRCLLTQVSNRPDDHFPHDS